MGLIDFFSSVADNFKNHYRQLAQSVSVEKPVSPNLQQIQTGPEAIPEPVKADTYEPSPEIRRFNDENNSETNSTQPSYEDEPESLPATDQPVTDYTTSLKRKAQLNYQMNLEFNLGAITQTVERLAEGDTEALEKFTAAGFGLQADMDFKGHQLVNAKTDETIEDPSHSRGMSLSRSKQARQFAYQSRNFGVQSFYDEATRIQKNLNTKSHGQHRLAVNKFALRYRMDSSMSFASLERFNIQTRDVSQNDPANLDNYLVAAGNAVTTSTDEMMTAFFDAVDAYLVSAEDQLTAKAAEYFNMAAEELGFSGEIVDNAREQFVGTITSFFDRVNTAVDQLQTRFAPQTAQLPVDENIEAPTVDYYVPEIARDKAELAIA